MAHVNFDGLNLWITLNRPERRAIHMPEVVVPRANFAAVAYVEDVWSHVRPGFGIRGIGYPRILLWGTAYDDEGRDFCILDQTKPGLILWLTDYPYARVMLSLPASEAWPLYARLREVIAEDTERRNAGISG
jgi:hypothetical protein